MSVIANGRDLLKGTTAYIAISTIEPDELSSYWDFHSDPAMRNDGAERAGLFATEYRTWAVVTALHGGAAVFLTNNAQEVILYAIRVMREVDRVGERLAVTCISSDKVAQDIVDYVLRQTKVRPCSECEAAAFGLLAEISEGNCYGAN
jgi:hypothetical protein